MSSEIDAYPQNNRAWERTHPDREASEEIFGLFGAGSHFHEQFGFYIDGVDENTAKLPSDWLSRSKTSEWLDGAKKIRAIAPAIDDLIVSKLHRLEPKDRDYILACHARKKLNVTKIKRLFATSGADAKTQKAAFNFLDELTPDPKS